MADDACVYSTSVRAESGAAGSRVAFALVASLAGVAAAVTAALQPGGPRMLAAVAALFLGFKTATLPRAGFARTLAYALLWPGMDPIPFEASRRPSGGEPRLLAAGALKAALGAGLIAAAVGAPLPPAARAWLAAAGALLAVHLGLFDVAAALWRRAGIPVGRICPEPWRSESLGEFWGRRWNVAFHEFARERLYRPLARRWGRGPAVAGVFLFSGLAHELAISWPAGGGYGLPTAYFALHGALLAAERRGALPADRRLAAAAVLVPLPILLHPAFLERVIAPWVGG